MKENIKSSLIITTINKPNRNIKRFRREVIINQIVRELINVMVMDVIDTTNKNLKINIGTKYTSVFNIVLSRIFI